jgi:hypothetical protein
MDANDDIPRRTMVLATTRVTLVVELDDVLAVL